MSGPLPTGFRLFRSQTSPVDFRGGVESVSGNGLVLGGWVDFDAMGERFRSVIGGASQSAFGDGGHLRLRIGGTYGVVDGDLVLDLEAAAMSFGAFEASQLTTNVWTGIQIVKVTGWGWTSTFNFAGLDMVPVV